MNHCKTIALVNQKGGVGKTTSTVNLGVGLAQAGNRVLLVDDDPQHSLTISLGIQNADDDLDTTLATAMQAEIRDESVPWEEGIIHSDEGVDLLPANIELSGVEMSLFNAMSREQVLKSVGIMLFLICFEPLQMSNVFHQFFFIPAADQFTFGDTLHSGENALHDVVNQIIQNM